MKNTQNNDETPVKISISHVVDELRKRLNRLTGKPGVRKAFDLIDSIDSENFANKLDELYVLSNSLRHGTAASAGIVRDIQLIIRTVVPEEDIIVTNNDIGAGIVTQTIVDDIVLNNNDDSILGDTDPLTSNDISDKNDETIEVTHFRGVEQIVTEELLEKYDDELKEIVVLGDKVYIDEDGGITAVVISESIFAKLEGTTKLSIGDAMQFTEPFPTKQ